MTSFPRTLLDAWLETTSKAVPEDSELAKGRTHDRQVRKIPRRGPSEREASEGRRRLVVLSFAGV